MNEDIIARASILNIMVALTILAVIMLMMSSDIVRLQRITAPQVVSRFPRPKSDKEKPAPVLADRSVV